MPEFFIKSVACIMMGEVFLPLFINSIIIHVPPEVSLSSDLPLPIPNAILIT